ncbi:glycoside hydrolase family 127 protein [Dellaglioa sp. BT-FLS60]
MKIKTIDITSKFWNRYRELIPEKVIPYQWNVINDSAEIKIEKEPGGPELGSEKSHAIANLKIAAKRQNGHHVGYTFQDTDVYKWLEAAAFTLKYHPDDKLKIITDDVVDLIYDAQDDDGYLVTYFQIEEPERKFKRLSQSHELYSMGHYIEAAVAYYEVTGNEKSLKVALKMADCIDKYFGLKEGQIPGVDGHPEIELALTKLYEVTKIERYLKLADFFINQRGQDPLFFQKQNQEDGIDNDLIAGMESITSEYLQASGPLNEQQTLQGHAVRVVYLCTGMAHTARLTNNKKLLDTCKRIWKNIVNKRMYVTGGIGSTNIGEKFTTDYDLPNDTMYGETCASVGMSFFARQMLELESNGEYGDILEKEIFNGALSGLSLDGTHFFYVNPLEADPVISKFNPSREHAITRRAEWFGVACCPSNIARLIASIDQYIYKVENNYILSDQFIANDTTFTNGVKIKQTNNYPWDGKINFNISNKKNNDFNFGIRIPKWSENKFTVKINKKETNVSVENGYVYIPIDLEDTEIELNLDFSIKIMKSNSNVRYNINKVGVQRGPLVYCSEQEDNDTDLWKINLKVDGQRKVKFEQNLLGGIAVIQIDALKIVDRTNDLYYESDKNEFLNDKVTMIPYYAWANRKDGQMSVWQNVYNK